MTKLGLGTVQLGLPYAGQADAPVMELEEAMRILDRAIQLNIQFFDTAVIYGESESRIGEFFSRHPDSKVEVSSKLPRFPREIWDKESELREQAKQYLRESLHRTRQSEFQLLQLHESDVAFLESPAVGQVMRSLLVDEPISSLGVSVYSVEEALCALDQDWVSALQIPVSILDQRFLSVELLQACRERKCRLIGRSLFLQGVLVNDARLPNVPRTDELLDIRHDLEQVANGIPLSVLSLQFAFHNLSSILDVALIGVQSQQELEQNWNVLQQLQEPIPTEMVEKFWSIGEQAEKLKLLDPRQWSHANNSR